MGTENCQDCDYVSRAEAMPSNGKCADCHGTGYKGNLLEVIGKPPADQECETCQGTGKCQTCYGKGYLKT